MKGVAAGTMQERDVRILEKKTREKDPRKSLEMGMEMHEVVASRRAMKKFGDSIIGAEEEGEKMSVGKQEVGK